MTMTEIRNKADLLAQALTMLSETADRYDMFADQMEVVSPIFETLKQQLDGHVADFAQDLAFDLDGRALTLEDLWINILPEGGIHTAHIHPHSVISGTTYVAMPEAASAIRFEDPRLTRRKSCKASFT